MATKLRRTLFIGLGGTGMRSLLNTKKMFYDTYGEIPPMIGFLGIDTDRGVYNNTLEAKDGTKISLDGAEQLSISMQNALPIYNRDAERYDWLPRCNVSNLSLLSDTGAGQIRSNGRFAITYHAENVANKLRSVINNISSATIIDNDKYELLSNKVEAHLVFSIAGGTGCGTFLNMAYLIKDTLPEVNLTGYAVMPDIFRAMSSGPGVANVYTNAFGATKDLDYLMALEPIHEPVTLKGFRNDISCTDRPFTAMFFIDNKNKNGDTYTNVNDISDMISLALATATGGLSVATASVNDNINQQIHMGLMDVGRLKKAWMAGLGVCEIMLNNRALADTYSLKAMIQLIARMTNGGCDDPALIANNWIDAEKIRENLGKDDVTNYFMSPTPQYFFSSISCPENPKAECESFIANQGMEPEAVLNQKLEDLKKRIAESLLNLVRTQSNRECGVYLIENILNSINNQLHLCDDEMADEINDRQKLLAVAQSAFDGQCQELTECMDTFLKLRKKEHIQDVCEATMNLATIRREIKRRELARQFYSWLLGELQGYYDKINIIATNLRTIHEQSLKQIDSILQGINTSSLFQYDLSTQIIDKISCPADDIVFNDFTTYLAKENSSVFSMAELTSESTQAILRRFTDNLPETQRLSNTRLNDMLADQDEESLKTLCKRAITKSTPLLPWHYHGWDSRINVPAHEYYYIGVGDEKQSVINKDLFRKIATDAEDIQFASTGMHDRVIIYRQIGVLPAFAPTSIDGYRNEYANLEAVRPMSSHWDVKLFERMSRERFDLDPVDKNDVDDSLSSWISALLYGFISYNPETKKYQIRSKALGGRPLYGYKVDLGDSRKAAYDNFCAGLHLIKPELDAEIKNLDIPGPQNTLRIRNRAAKQALANGTYLTEISLCPIPLADLALYPAEEELINAEMEFIDQFIPQ